MIEAAAAVGAGRLVEADLAVTEVARATATAPQFTDLAARTRARHPE
jgi:hypothetical protein